MGGLLERIGNLSGIWWLDPVLELTIYWTGFSYSVLAAGLIYHFFHDRLTASGRKQLTLEASLRRHREIDREHRKILWTNLLIIACLPLSWFCVISAYAYGLTAFALLTDYTVHFITNRLSVVVAVTAITVGVAVGWWLKLPKR